MYKLIFSKKSRHFFERNPNYKPKVIDAARQFIRFLSGNKENIDVKKMKGKWEGFYRIKSGRIRILLSINIDTEILYIERVGFRGDVYKDKS
jgi:mRNA interferase RelE/StbE